MAKAKPKTQGPELYKLLERGERKLPVELDPSERDARAHTLAKLVQNFRALDAERADVARTWRVKLKAAKEEIDEAAKAVEEGVEQKKFVVEKRAVFSAQTIDLVRMPDEEVLESRPMTEEEKRDLLQQSLDVTATAPESAEAHAAEVEEAGLLGLPYRPEEDIVDGELEAVGGEAGSDAGPDEDEGQYDEGEYEALGLPPTWPRKWRGKAWKVGEAELAESDVLEVYLRTKASGIGIDELGEQATWLNRAQIGRALSLLKKADLVNKADGGKWCAVEGVPEEQEPGRNDPLPEASAAPKPKRRRAKDTGEAAINTALGQSEAMEAGA